MAQDYYLRFINEVIGKENLQSVTALIGEAAAKAKDAKLQSQDWGKAMELAARNAGVSVKDLIAQLKLQSQESERLRKTNDDLAREYEKTADREIAAIRKVSAERKKAEEEAAGRRFGYDNSSYSTSRYFGVPSGSGGGGGGVGGGGGGFGGAGSLFGRVGGRIAGAELGGLAGIPGGGFIGSQIAYSAGITGGAAAGLLGGAAAIYGGIELVKHTDELLKYAQAQRNLAIEVGLTSGQMAALSSVASATGLNLEGVAKSVSSLSEELSKGGGKSKEITEALSALGLGNVTAFKDTQAALNDITEALAKIPDKAERSRLAVALLGESGRQLAASIDTFGPLDQKFQLSDHTIDNLAHIKDLVNEIGVGLKNWSLEALSSLVDFAERGSSSDILGVLAGVLSNTPGLTVGAAVDAARRAAYGHEQPGSALTPEAKALLGTNNANISASNLTYANAYDESHGTPQAQHEKIISDLTEQGTKAREDLIARRITQDQYESQKSGINAKAISENARFKRQQEITRQREEFGKLEPIGDLDISQLRSENLQKRFPDIYQEPSVIARRNQVFNAIQGESGRDFLNEFIPAQNLRLGITKLAPSGRAQSRNEVTDFEEQNRVERADQERAIRAVTEQRRVSGIATTSQYQLAESQTGLGTATRAGRSRYGLTEEQIKGLELSQGLSTIQRQAGPRRDELFNQRLDSYTAAQGYRQAGATDQYETSIAEMRKVENEQLILENTTRKSSIDLLNKFNEAIDETNTKIRNQVASDITSIALGAQEGEIHGGRPGQGALNALRGIGTKLEGQLLTNALKPVLDTAGITGPGGGLSKLGGFLGPLASGTILEKTDDKKSIKDVADNTGSKGPIVEAVNKITTVLTGGKLPNPPVGATAGLSIPGLTGPAAPGSVPATGGGVYDLPNAQNVFSNPLSGFSFPTGFSGSGTSDIAAAVSAISPLAGISTSTSPSADLAATAKSLTSVSKFLGGAGLGVAGIFGGVGVPGVGGAPGHAETTTEQVGSIAAVAGEAIAGYEGIATAARGGAKNVTGGVGTALGAAGLALGPAGIPLDIAGAFLGLFSSFIPSGQTVRTNQEAKTLFTQQYLAPPSQNITESGSGTYADYDTSGNIRTSNYSPYEATADPYIDVPRRTVVPGGIISQFGGGAPITSALRPQNPVPININVQTMDSKSFNDNASKILDAAHLGLQGGYHPILSTLRGNLGLQ